MSDVTNEREKRQQEFLRLLAELEFGRRYYEFYDSRAGKKGESSLSLADFERALAETGLIFEYHKGDQFFSHEESYRSMDFELNVQLKFSMAEFIMGFDTPYGGVGGPFHSLAARSEALRRPGWKHDPLYPRLPFVTFEDLREVDAFAVGLYKEVRDVVVSRDWS